MKRFARFFLTAGFIAFVYAAASAAQAREDGCAREDLAKIADRYFASIREHKTADLPLASTAKFTENGVRTDIGKGFWETAGKPLLRRTLIDTRKCVVATIAVMEEPFSSKTLESLHRAAGAAWMEPEGLEAVLPVGLAAVFLAESPAEPPACLVDRKHCPKRGPSDRSCSHPGLRWKKVKSPKLKR